MSARTRSAVPPEGAEFITYEQAACLMQLSVDTLRRWVRAGRLRHYGEGRLLRLRRSEVIEALQHVSEKKHSVADRAAEILSRVGA